MYDVGMQLRARITLTTLLLPILLGALAQAAPPKKPDKKAEAARLRAELQVKDGDAWFELGDLTRAQASYEQALVLQPGGSLARVRMAAIAWRLGDGDRALALLGEVDKTGAMPADGEALYGEILFARKQYGESARHYAIYVKAVPSDGWAILALARAYRGMGEGGDGAAREQAVRILKILAGATDNALAGEAEEELYTLLYGEAGKQFRQGKLALVAGNAKQAVTILTQVVAAQPSLEEAFYLLGVALMDPSVNQRADARAAFAKAPSVKEAQLRLGSSLFEDATGAADLDKAEAALRRAIELSPTYQDAFYYLGQVLDNRGDTKNAAEAYQKAMNIDPDTNIGQLSASKYTLLTGNSTAMGPVVAESDPIDAAAEIQMAQAMEDKARADGLLLDDPKQQARFDGMLEKLVAVAELKELSPRLFLIKSPDINAITIPGGRIFIYTGLIDFVKRTAGDRDEVLAAVVAHELAHAALRHVPLGLRSWSAAAQGGRYDVRQELSRMATTLTRVHEYEADHYGALFLHRAGMATQGMIDLFEAMKKEMGDGMRNGSHPTKTERIAKIKDFLIDLRGKSTRLPMGDKALKEGNYELAIRHYEVYLGVFPSDAAAHERSGLAYHRMGLKAAGFQGIWKRPTDLPAATAPTAAAMEKARADAATGKVDPKREARWLKRAVLEYKAAIAAAPDRGSARANLASALSDLGEFKAARTVVSEGVKLQRVNLEMERENAGGKAGPNTAKLTRGLALLENGLAIALATAADYAGARTYLAAAAKHDPKLWDTSFNQATVEELAGDPVAGAAAMRVYLTFDKDLKSPWGILARARLANLDKAVAAKKVGPGGKPVPGGKPPVGKPPGGKPVPKTK